MDLPEVGGEPHENWAMMQTRNIEGILEQSGVYELPKPQEVRQALGNRQKLKGGEIRQEIKAYRK